MCHQYDQFLSLENFILAYTRLKTMQRSKFKSFFYDDFKAFELYFDDNIQQLCNDVKEGIYSPSASDTYYIPKKKNLARPISLLNLLDQIVYQAIANVIADVVYDKLNPYFNINTFGNIFIKTNDKENKFFYEKWKSQWRNYNNKKQSTYNSGYEYIAQFDIASFYDTIDHGILISILEKEFKIEEEILNLLKKCLYAWTSSTSSDTPFNKNSGIPQGPVSSALFGEIYLFHLDKEMRKQRSVVYFRYSDDVTIMAKNEEHCLKMIVYLDLLAKDLSLIPQSEKIKVIHIKNINEYNNHATKNFSKITREYKAKENNLNSGYHTKLKKQLIETIKSGECNKTIINFSLYKLNIDDEVKKLLLSNIEKLELHYDEIIYYFNKHYPNDNDFKDHVIKYLLGETVLFQYNKSLLFKNYKALDFDISIFDKNSIYESRFWIVQYEIIEWLCSCGKNELALNFYKGDNYYIYIKLNYTKLKQLQDKDSKITLIKSLIEDKNPLTSMHGLYMWDKEYWDEKLEINVNNNFSKRIVSGMPSDFFSHTMHDEYKITVPDSVLNIIKEDSSFHKEIKDNLAAFLNNKIINPPISLMYLNLVNNMIFDIICKEISYTEGDFGANLDQIQDRFPIAHKSFKRINSLRNSRTPAHYKDKDKKIPSKITEKEYLTLLSEINLADAYYEVFTVLDAHITQPVLI